MSAARPIGYGDLARIARDACAHEPNDTDARVRAIVVSLLANAETDALSGEPGAADAVTALYEVLPHLRPRVQDAG